MKKTIKGFGVTTIRGELIGAWRTPHLEIYNTRKDAREAWLAWNKDKGNEKVKILPVTISFTTPNKRKK